MGDIENAQFSLVRLPLSSDPSPVVVVLKITCQKEQILYSIVYTVSFEFARIFHGYPALRVISNGVLVWCMELITPAPVTIRVKRIIFLRSIRLTLDSGAV